MIRFVFGFRSIRFWVGSILGQLNFGSIDFFEKKNDLRKKCSG